MLSGHVSLLFLSLTGTSGYSSGAGSVSSHAQQKPESSASSFPTSSHGTQPSRQKVFSECTSRSAACALEISCVQRSKASCSADFCSASAVSSASFSASCCSQAAMASSVRRIFSAAVPCTPSNVVRAKPASRSAAPTASAAHLWTKTSRYRLCWSALICSSCTSSAASKTLARSASKSVCAGTVPSRMRVCCVPRVSSGSGSCCHGTKLSRTAVSLLFSAARRLRASCASRTAWAVSSAAA